MIYFTTIFAQAGGGGAMYQMVFFGAMLLIFWLFLIRPQARKQKQQRQFTEDLGAGDKIVTASGIIGKVVRIEEKTITLDVGKTQIQITKNAVSKELTDAIYPTEG